MCFTQNGRCSSLTCSSGVTKRWRGSILETTRTSELDRRSEAYQNELAVGCPVLKQGSRRTTLERNRNTDACTSQGEGAATLQARAMKTRNRNLIAPVALVRRIAPSLPLRPELFLHLL